MSNQNGDKKLSMSLDDIIKMNRRNKNGRNPQSNRPNAGGNRPRQPQQQQQQRRNNNNNNNRNNNNNNNRGQFGGVSNRSKAIGKNNRNRRVGRATGGGVGINGRRPYSNFGGPKGNNRPRPVQQNQQARQTPRPQQPKPQQQQQQLQNRNAGGGGIRNKLARRPGGRGPIGQQQRRRGGIARVGAGAPLRKRNNVGNNIAMQAARRNVQKAKRLLVTRRQQIQPKRFQNQGAAKTNLQKKFKLARKQIAGNPLRNRLGKPAGRLGAAPIRQQVQQRQKIQRQQKIRSNRNRIGGGKNRMVMM